jgi:NAD(P)-dependent dehydrogenase (short-subunit alcohol dehydrogenase family)
MSKTKTWIITGATAGLGAALAQSALEAGEQVVGTARRPGRFAPLRERFGDRLLAVAHDVRDRDGAAGVVEQAVARFGGVDVLVNNAGAEEITDAALQDMLDQHLLGPVAFVRAVLPVMRAAGSGSIVQMSSQGGRISFPAVGSYSAGKFALEGWSEALSAEVAPFGIRVLIVEPSRFRTEFNAPGVLLTAQARADYESVTGAVRQELTTADGRQEGDPVRAAAAIRRVLDDPEAPLRLPLGAEAVRNLTGAYERSLADARRWAHVSESADFPDVAPAQRAFATA